MSSSKFQHSVSEERARRAAEARSRCKQMGRVQPSDADCRAQGKTLREGTVDKRDRVRCASCVADTGRKGSRRAGTPRIAVRKGTLHPWKAMETAKTRHAALHIAVERHKQETGSSEREAALAIARKLNVLYIYRKNDARPAVALTCNRVLDDEEWLRNEYGLEPLDRAARQCQMDERAALAGTLAQEAKKTARRQPADTSKPKSQQFRSAATWSQFLSANKGRGYSMAELGAAWKRLH